MATLNKFWNDAGAWLREWFSHPTYGAIIAWITLIVVAWFATFITRRFILRAVRSLVGRSKAKWDDALVEHKVFHRLAHLAPALVFYAAGPLIFPADDQESYQQAMQRIANAWMFLAGARALSSFIDAMVAIAQDRPGARGKPLRSYSQVFKLVMWLAVSIIVVGTLTDRSPWALLTGLGAMTAIILLVFKDSILGFVASVQIASYDMVRQGDWVEMPKHGADGDVLEIGLHTVKVQNWDKTITTIPTYAFMSDSFKNWRGMSESGGRRIKRSISLDMTSVRFLQPEDLNHLKRIQYIGDYLEKKEQEVAAWNAEHVTEADTLVNGRHMTNLGTFRAYLENYLRNHEQIRKDMTFLVRQLEPSKDGLPIQIYVFSAEQRWAHYEGIMADIFDHVIAVIPEFGLRVFQQPSGADFQALGGGTGK
ncbi:MAG: mechanosensitive ion channel family protein [Planctomycetes bacterium]|nr:mechanosensitive ion channel family protein [Planctomycetota bacterium]MCP4771096.1 mechanosensitive ion channel family protein [Planctomycetota bacterium]MCP4860803.1 mechanosensitive ion channel family protein [Planctomycetota bacterium]